MPPTSTSAASRPWLALLMVLLQFVVVVMRYVFGVGFIFMQEGVIYLHATLFMVGAGYTMLPRRPRPRRHLLP